jgi:probable F420-dependent oxidoreductase
VRPVKFGLQLVNSAFARTRAMAERAEALGFDSVAISDHFMNAFSGAPGPILECYMTLSALAAVTRKLRLAPLVTGMSYRNPALLAKMIATLDHISGGRFIAGIGAGWMRQEYEAFGYPYPSNAERIAQLAEAIEVLMAMWTQEEPVFAGRYFSIDKAYCFPKPVQKPHPPIMIGGSGGKLLEVAARYGDIVNLTAAIRTGRQSLRETVKFDRTAVAGRIAMLHDYARKAGRNPADIAVSGFMTVAIAADKEQADKRAADVVRQMGFADVETARRSPMVLLGTPEEARRELRSRIEELGMTYYFTIFLSSETIDLFAREVIPEFAPPQ